jgi:hypothetical protein
VRSSEDSGGASAYGWSRAYDRCRIAACSRARASGERAPTLGDSRTGVAGRSAIDWLSWYYHPRKRRFHYPGALQGFWSSVYRDEEQRYSVVYVSNNSMPPWLRPWLTRALIDIVDGRAPPPVESPSFEELKGADLSLAAGRFRVAGVGTVKLAARGNRLFVRVNDGLEYPSVDAGDHVRYVPGLDVWFGFEARDSMSRSPGARRTDERFARLRWLSIFAVGEGVRLR